MEPCREACGENADGASDATTEETEATAEAPALPSAVVLEERVNQRVAHFLTTLTVEDLKKYNPPSKHHCKTEEDFKAAFNKLQVFLYAFVGLEGGVKRTYRYARAKDFGRMFCSKGTQNATCHESARVQRAAGLHRRQGQLRAAPVAVHPVRDQVHRRRRRAAV